MLTRRLIPLLVLTGLAFGLLACNLYLPQTEADASRVSAILGGLDAWINLGFPIEP